MRGFKIFQILSVLTLLTLSFSSFGQEKVIEEKFACGPIKVTVISKIEPVNSTKEILKNTFLITEQTIIIGDKKIKVGPSLEEYNNKVPGGYLKNNKDEKTKSLYERYKNYPLYLADVSCYCDDKKNYYVEVGYAKLCNGTHCEYNELYAQDGKLLISDKQRIYLAYTDLNKMKQVISQYLNFIKKRKLKHIKAQRIYPNFDPWKHLIIENPDRVIELITDEDFK